jgi:lipopolysaccharide export system permease protein
MSLIANYLRGTVLRSILLVVVLIAGMQVFVLSIGELDEIGRGDYGIWQALLHVLLQLPYQMVLFFPMACCAGCILGLGRLAESSELVVIRTAGVSVLQITRMVLGMAIWLVLVMALVGEFVVPKAVAWSERTKAYQVSGGQALATQKGLWIRMPDKNQFVQIETVSSEGELRGLTIYDFNNKLRLSKVTHAKHAVYQGGYWLLQDVASTQLSEEQSTANHQASGVWRAALKPGVILSGQMEPASLSVMQLYHYIKQNYRSFQHGYYPLVFWQRWMQPVSVLVMMLLAIPFIFGPLRSSTMGLRIIAGIAVGFGFYILNQIVGPVSLVYQVPAVIAAVMPVLIAGGASLWLLWRVR